MVAASLHLRAWLRGQFRGQPGGLWVALLMLALCGGGQSCAQNLRYLSQQAWSTEEGLPQSSVHSIVQTPDGFLWIATEGGLARFDGMAFRIFDRGSDPAFRSDDICCLAVNRDGLWVGTEDGLLRLQEGQLQGQFRRYGSSDGLASPFIESVQVLADGSLVVDSASGWAEWGKGRFHALARSPAELASDAEGLVAVPGHPAWRFSTAMVSTAGRRWRVGQDLPIGRIQTVVVDRQGVAWVGMTNGLFVLNSGDAKPVAVVLHHGNSVLSIFQDREGNHWVGTETSGLHVLRRLAFRSEPALVDQPVTSVVQTNNGDVWIGTRDDGLRRVRNGVLDEPVSAGDLSSAVVQCLAPAPGGGLWAGTPDGLNYIHGRTVHRVTLADGLPDDDVRSLAVAGDGSVWVATRQGLAHIRGINIQGPKLLTTKTPLRIQTYTTVDGLGGNLIGALLLRSGEVWAATSGGLSVVRRNGRIRTFTTQDGLRPAIVTAMAQDYDGHLWVAENDGSLSLLEGQRFVPVDAFPAGTGSDGNIEGITFDRQGFAWFRMDRGIRRVVWKDLLRCVGAAQCAMPKGAMTAYGLADGLPNDEVVEGEPSNGWLTRKQEIWFPTRGGVAIVDTENLPVNTVPPPVALLRFAVDDITEPLGSASLKIPFSHARFTIEYAGLSFTAPSEVRYRFRLQGFDKTWTEIGNRRSATYTNLAPGAYVFRVQAMNNDGVWNRTGATLRFRILAPFYRRWWFVLLGVLLLLTLLAGMYLLRLRGLRGEFDAVLAERNRMAREIHDTLAQGFVGASLQLDLIAQHLHRGKVELALDQVKRARQLVNDGLQEARRSIWELRANRLQETLPTRLAKIVQLDTFADLKPRLHLGGAYRPVESRIERELLRIAQEALSNALHHAHSAVTSVELHYSSDMLMLTIQDEGVGFVMDEVSMKTGHYGLLGMKERAAMIGGVLEVTSEPGRGTKVTLRVPLAQSVR